METIISIAQFAVSLALIVLILLQERESGMSGFLGAGGGSDSGGFYQKRRGLERTMFLTTIVLVVLFGALALLNLFV